MNKCIICLHFNNLFSSFIYFLSHYSTQFLLSTKFHMFIKATKKLGAKLKNSISFFSLMADFNPPSFSLGLDFDFEPVNHNHPLNTPTHENPVTLEPGEKELEDDVEFQLRVSDSEHESPKKFSRNRLRRLRRGGSSSSKPISTPIISFVDDDIEEFSDEENARLSKFIHSHFFGLYVVFNPF